MRVPGEIWEQKGSLNTVTFRREHLNRLSADTTAEFHRRNCRVRQLKIVMASLDDAGRTTTLYRLKVYTTVTTIQPPVFNVERVRRRSLERTVWTSEDKKPDSKLRVVTVPEDIEVQNIPSASMEAKGVIPEGREAWSDHCLHTERVHRRSTFSVAQRFHQEHDHWRVAHRHDSHHGLCDHATNSSARNDRASDR